ncbi:unnamed protein product [Prorocentrum cordatum]|uniref:MBD domain-containing protein n=1 Tax=Prorocentrum cordatum TaxID=2364126 RepID=A0ABN9TSG3_9DINO|nr:unnamed protein product [Polarella glacialis]
MADDESYGEDAWKAAGSPLFTRLWTYDEMLTVERPGGRGRKKKGVHTDFKRPENWPDDVEVETGSWVFWLPEGWAQGIRTQKESGKQLKCFMSPEGKRFWHKPVIEKYLGRELPKIEPKVKDDDDEPRVRYVTDPDAIPNWPEPEDDGSEWLPREFKIGFRQLPRGLHRIYVPPGKEDVGFLYHRHSVIEYLAGKTDLSPLGTSKTMTAVSEGAMHRKRKAEPMLLATLADFTQSASLRAVKLGGSADTYAAALSEALRGATGTPDHAGLAADAVAIRARLVTRGFMDVELIYVSCASDGKEKHPIAAALSGFYHRRPDPWEGQPLYQSIFLQASARAGVACGHAHLFWSAGCAAGGRWKVGELVEDGLAGCMALSSDSSMSGKWLLAPLE